MLYITRQRSSQKSKIFGFVTEKEPLELKDMAEVESKFGSILSWADEVEKEEEEAAATQAQLHQKQKPKPFASARSREVVLQEKAIDWRKLDLHFQQPSRLFGWITPLFAIPSIYSLQPPDGKICKANIPTSAMLVVNRTHSNPPSKCLKHKVGDNILVDLNSFAAQNQESEVFVPPLRYPPRNAIPILFESGVSYCLYGLDKSRQGFQHKSYLKLAKENTLQRHKSHKLQISQNTDYESSMHATYHQQIVDKEPRRSPFNENSKKLESAANGQSVGNDRSLRKSPTGRNRKDLENLMSANEKSTPAYAIKGRSGCLTDNQYTRCLNYKHPRKSLVPHFTQG